MYTEKSKKIFTKPICEIVSFELADIITTSGEDNWDIGEEEIFEIGEIQQNWSLGEAG